MLIYSVFLNLLLVKTARWMYIAFVSDGHTSFSRSFMSDFFLDNNAMCYCGDEEDCLLDVDGIFPPGERKEHCVCCNDSFFPVRGAHNLVTRD